MTIPEDLKYTRTHEWVKVEGDTVTCGLTDYAQSELSDIVFVKLKPVGTVVEKTKPFGTVEAVKAVSDMYAPISGEIVAINETLANTPDVVNKDPYGEGWMVKIKMSQPKEVNELLDAKAYKEMLPE